MCTSCLLTPCSIPFLNFMCNTFAELDVGPMCTSYLVPDSTPDRELQEGLATPANLLQIHLKAAHTANSTMRSHYNTKFLAIPLLGLCPNVLQCAPVALYQCNVTPSWAQYTTFAGPNVPCTLMCNRLARLKMCTSCLVPDSTPDREWVWPHLLTSFKYI